MEQCLGRTVSSLPQQEPEERSMSEAQIELRRTRVSLFYLASYLFPLSMGLLISPTGTFRLLGSAAETCPLVR